MSHDRQPALGRSLDCGNRSRLVSGDTCLWRAVVKRRDIEREIDFELIKTLIRCDVEAGKLYWLPKFEDNYHLKIWNIRFAGKEAGRITQHYRQVTFTIEGIRYYANANRLVVSFFQNAWVDPDKIVDHKNGDELHDRFVNLRICEISGNCQNSKLNAKSTSGYKGVSWCKKYLTFTTNIRYNNNTKFLGWFDDPIDAALAYDQAALKYHGEFAKTNAMLGLLA